MDQQVRENVFLDRMISTLSGGFAALATVLAAIGRTASSHTQWHSARVRSAVAWRLVLTALASAGWCCARWR